MWTQLDIDCWRLEIKPLSAHSGPGLRAALAFYRKELLGAKLTCPLPYQISLTPGHFFALVSHGGGGKKGWIDKAVSAPHALQLIESGEVGIPDVMGCEAARVRELHLFPDVIRFPQIIAKNPDASGSKLFFLKRYEPGGRRPRAKVAVMYLQGEELKPASFYTFDLTIKWLNQNARKVLWKKSEG